MAEAEDDQNILQPVGSTHWNYTGTESVCGVCVCVWCDVDLLDGQRHSQLLLHGSMKERGEILTPTIDHDC